MKTLKLSRLVIAAALAAGSSLALAHGHHSGGIATKSDKVVKAPSTSFTPRSPPKAMWRSFIWRSRARLARQSLPNPGSSLAAPCSPMFWPTSLDPSTVGFEAKAGILAFAVTSHSDFDDTPLFDENGDGNPKNDGGVWHSHWVVLQPDDACGKGALKVVDIPKDTKPKLPKTWPGLPILIDSPGWNPIFKKDSLEVRVPFDDIGVVTAASFDGVTAALRVNASVHNPLLCVVDVFKIGSGNLSLPGKVNK
jgi:hypothetical protein